MKVLLFKVGEEPKEVEIENSLESMQKLVGGYIQCVGIPTTDKHYQLVCDEEGLIRGKPFNREIGGYQIHGDFFICDLDDDCEFTGLTDKQIKNMKFGFSCKGVGL